MAGRPARTAEDCSIERPVSTSISCLSSAPAGSTSATSTRRSSRRFAGKAGVPAVDVRANIISHRASSPIATQLYNAKEPMTLYEMQAWLGHGSPETTQHYSVCRELHQMGEPNSALGQLAA
jgi:hypothetical protein